MFISIFYFVHFRENEICKFMSRFHPFRHWFRISDWLERILSFRWHRKTSSNQYLIKKFERLKISSKTHYHNHLSDEMRWDGTKWDGCIRWLNFKFKMPFNEITKMVSLHHFTSPRPSAQSMRIDSLSVFNLCDIEKRKLRRVPSIAWYIILTWCLNFSKLSRLNFIINRLYDGKININLFKSIILPNIDRQISYTST